METRCWGPLKYHPRIYNHGKWQCCGKARRSGEGCAVIDNYEEKPLSTLTAALSGMVLFVNVGKKHKFPFTSSVVLMYTWSESIRRSMSHSCYS